MIEIENVSKTYDGKKFVLQNLNLKIDDGEFVFIVGHSGAGKTTLTKLLLCEERVTSGSIRVGKYDLTKLKNRKIPYFRRTMGFVFQDFRLFQNKTVYENVAFALEITGVPKRFIKERVPYFIDLVGLKDKENEFPAHLSGGEQQRLSLARALVNKPDIIIADEPTGNLDPELSYGIMDLLLRINKIANKTVIVVTHEKNLVDKFQQRVITIGDGYVVSDIPKGSYK